MYMHSSCLKFLLSMLFILLKVNCYDYDESDSSCQFYGVNTSETIAGRLLCLSDTAVKKGFVVVFANATHCKVGPPTQIHTVG